jgi:hypothetical protein
MQSTARALLLAAVYLLAACGGGSVGTAPPTLGPLARDTPSTVPTQPAPPTLGPLARDTPSAVPTQPAPPTAPPSAEIPAVVTAQAGAGSLLIRYQKSGGIAGIDETLTVYDDGTIEVRRKSGVTSTQADPSDIQALQKLLASPEFAALQLPVQPPAPDQFVYELTVAGRAKPIVATDSADTPAVLRQLIDALERLKTQAK